MPQVETTVTRILDKVGLEYHLHLHPAPLRSLEQAASERGLKPQQIVRSLVFRLEDGSFVLVLVAGPDPLDWARLRQHLGVLRMTTASPEQVEQVTGYPPGAVSPFGLRQRIRLLADRSLLQQDRISLGAGIRNAGIEMDRASAMEFLEPEWGEFREEA